MGEFFVVKLWFHVWWPAQEDTPGLECCKKAEIITIYSCSLSLCYLFCFVDSLPLSLYSICLNLGISKTKIFLKNVIFLPQYSCISQRQLCSIVSILGVKSTLSRSFSKTNPRQIQNGVSRWRKAIKKMHFHRATARLYDTFLLL